MGLLEDIQKECGQSDDNHDVTQWLSTGVCQLNYILSGKYHGGLPVGRITEIYGKESCGKTAIATMAMVETQRLGGFAVFLDYEHSFSMAHAERFGLSNDPNMWLYKQPTTAEEGFALINKIIEVVRRNDTDRYITIVVDSIAAMVTKTQQETAFGDEKMNTKLGLPAVMSFALPKISSMVNRSNVTLIMLNQTRDSMNMYGDPIKTPGGNAPKFYSSVRVQLSKTKSGRLEADGECYGEIVKAKCTKNKTAPPLRECSYNADFRTGIDFVASHIDAASSMGLLGSSKGWCEYDGKKYRAAQLTELLRMHPAEYERFLAESFKD